MFNKDIRVSLLLDFYGDLLSDRKRQVTELYYNEDLSLSEIADITGISRQGVRDAVKKSESELFEMEEKLGLVERYKILKQELERISTSLSVIETNDPLYNEILTNSVSQLNSLNL